MADKIIELKNVTYTYPLVKKHSLENVSFSIEKGKLYGISGHNGSGKTTLCINICGFGTKFEKGTLEGEILIKGKHVDEYADGELSGMIGYVLQNPFSQISGVRTTVFEEIGYGLDNLGVDPDTMEERIVAIAEETDIVGLLLKNPYELSGGQQQRVALASVLVLNPEILVIDEPTSQLDPEGTESIFKIIRKLKDAGKTILLVEHKMDLLAEYADEMIIMEEGKCIAFGPTKEILTDMSLIEHNVQLPQLSLVFNELRNRGKDYGEIPLLYEDAIRVLKEER